MMEKLKNQSQLEKEIRRRVEAKYEERNALLIHLASYGGVNVLVWFLWLGPSGGFPWPLFVTLGWGIGLFAHLLDYYNKHGGGAQKREARIDEEVQRHLERLHDLDAQPDEAVAVYDLDELEPRHLRLTDDGELVNLEDLDEDEAPPRYRRGDSVTRPPTRKS